MFKFIYNILLIMALINANYSFSMEEIDLPSSLEERVSLLEKQIAQLIEISENTQGSIESINAIISQQPSALDINEDQPIILSTNSNSANKTKNIFVSPDLYIGISIFSYFAFIIYKYFTEKKEEVISTSDLKRSNAL